MNTKLLWIITRTPLHVGAGSSVGAIDMPVARERHTQIPIIPGSGLKGVLRDEWNDEQKRQEQEELFGPDTENADKGSGNLIVGEARCVCFPVRSAKGGFAWLTSPLALARLAREKGTAKYGGEIVLNDKQCLAPEGVRVGNRVVLEEYAFEVEDAVPDTVIGLLSDAFDDDLWKSLKERLVVAADGIFSHFCANACEVQQRIRIDDETGTVAQHALFNQENVPSETVFYAVMSERKDGALNKLAAGLPSVLQIGGDETVGLGWCSVRLEGGAK